jgi:hypothetical protein
MDGKKEAGCRQVDRNISSHSRLILEPFTVALKELNLQKSDYVKEELNTVKSR